jgi:hypothetical protein
MPEINFDLSGLHSRINEIKVETTFTRDFLECLMKRHDLKYSIPDEYTIDDVPDTILDSLRNGELPSEEALLQLSSEIQNQLMFELVWVCGMNAIAFYTKDQSQENDTFFENIMAMLEVSPAHYIGCYIVAVYTLLMCRVPTIEMIETITNNFSQEQIHLQRDYDMYVELVAGVYTRYQEDQIYYFSNTEEN